MVKTAIYTKYYNLISIKVFQIKMHNGKEVHGCEVNKTAEPLLCVAIIKINYYLYDWIIIS